MLQPYLIEADGRYFELPQREGEALVSFAFGVITDRIMWGHPDHVQGPMDNYIVWEANDCRFRGSKILESTGLFKAGSQSLYWAEPLPDGMHKLNCWTPALVLDATPLERLFDVMKVSNLHQDAVWNEVARLAEVRASLGLLKAD